MGIVMKKRVTLTLAIMLVAIVAVLLPGCGSDTKQAKKYMQQGDELVKQYEGEHTAWEQSVNSATSIADLDKIKDSANDMSKTAGEARAAYEKILSLKGVEDYALYADIKMEILDKQQEFISLTNVYLDQLAPMISSGDVTNLSSIGDKYGSDVKKLTDDIYKLIEEAQKLKTDKKL